VSLRYLTVEEVAERYRCSVRTIHERVTRGEVPHRKLPGCHRLLFAEADLLAFEAGAELELVEIRGGRIVRPREAA
jgi:excisionase family DNA binding protein